ncbi:MAG: sodium:solute symporter [Bacillus sp. (in: firmicutes)]
MNLSLWTWVSTIVLSLFFLFMSLRFKNKADLSFAHYAIAGGTLPFFLILFTDIATIMGVGNFVGHSSKGYEIGLANIPFVIGEQGAKIIFALLFAGLAARFTYKSIGEMMNDLMLRDRLSRSIIGLLTASIMIAWVGGQAKGMGDLFAIFTGTDPIAMIILFTVVFLIYTSVGGMYSVVWTDLIQGALLIGIAIWFYIQVFAKIDFSFTTLKSRLADVDSVQLAQMNLSFGEIATLFITGCFGILAAQIYWQRCFAADKPKTASRAMLYSGFVAIIFTCLATLSGLIVKTENPDIAAESAISWLIMEEMTEFAALSFFILVFLAAISSASSLLHAAAVVIVNDLVIPWSKDTNDKKLVGLTRICVLIVGVFSVGAALWADSIIGLFSLAYTMTGGGVVPVLIIGLLWKRNRQDPFSMGMQNSAVSVWGGRIGLVSGAVASLTFGILWGVAISMTLTILFSLLLPTNRALDLVETEKSAQS